MFDKSLIDRSPRVFQPRVAPEPEAQERLEEKLREAAMRLRRRAYKRPYIVRTPQDKTDSLLR